MTTATTTTTNTTSTSTTAATATATTEAAAQTSANQFLQILLTELQNQNPTDAVDTKDFTTQLAQYSTLEQQIDTNTKLDTLISDIKGSTGTLAPTSYLGTTVDYSSPTAPVQNSSAIWTYSTSGASTVNISVADASGNVVYTGTGDATAGTHTLTLAAESTVTDGTPLTITVTAADSSGASIKPTVDARATIDAVDGAGTSTTLEASGYSFDATTVTRIATTHAATATSSTSSSSTGS